MMSTLAVAAGAASQARRLTPPPTQAQPATTRSSYPNHTSDLSSSTATTRPSSPPHHERSRNNNRPTSAPAMRTSITALPTIGTCLHKLPYLSPEDVQPLIAHNSSPRSDEGVREGMLFDALAITQKARRSSHGSSSLPAAVLVGSPPTPMPESYMSAEPPATGCIACNNAIASAHPQRPLQLPSAPGVGGIHVAAPSPPRSPAPSATSSRSRSRPPSVASNSSKKIFSLTPLDAPPSSIDHLTADVRQHHPYDLHPRSPAFSSSSFERDGSSSSATSSDYSDSDPNSDSDSEDEDMRCTNRSRRFSAHSAYSAYSSDGSGAGGGGTVGARAGRMLLSMSNIPPPSDAPNGTRT